MQYGKAGASSAIQAKDRPSAPPNPRIVVFDPSQLWPSLSVSVLLPATVSAVIQREGVKATVTRVEMGPIPDADIHVAVVPDRGFSRDEARSISQIRPEGLDCCCFIAVIDNDMLKPVSRGGFGFESLHNEVRREYGSSPVLVRPGVDDGILEELLPQLARLAENRLRDAEEQRTASVISALAAPILASPPPTKRLSEIVGLLKDVSHVGALLTALSDCRGNRADLTRKFSELLEDWHRLAEQSRSKCLAAARGAQVHGVGAEDIIKGLADVLPEVEDIVRHEFTTAPNERLRDWANRCLAAVSTPEVVLPVVGVFSSGKTTLINHLLGPSPEGHALLRTSQNHNTALLARFHRGSPQALTLTWRKTIDLELLWHGDPSTRPLCAPSSGRIEKVDVVAQGFLITLRTPNGEVRWLQLGPERRPLPHVRPGREVQAGQPLSDGIDAEAEAPGLVAERPTARLSMRPWAIAAMLSFIDRGLIEAVKLDVHWRERHVERKSRPSLREGLRAALDRPPYRIRNATLAEGSSEYREALTVLRALVDDRKERLTGTTDIPLGAQRYPVAIRVEARVRGNRCEPKTYPLESEDDWSWFQGLPDNRAGENGPVQRGFAESAEAAWLVQQADIYVDSPLFRLVSIIDTPGLDSISEHHDRITETCIHRGQAFLVMVRVGHATLSAAVERTFHMIVQSLSAQGVPRNRWGERVFVVLNWFRRDVGAQTEDQAKRSLTRFIDRLKGMLNTEVPQVYVVELSPTKVRENPEWLLGFPSLATLKRDLRSYIGVRGIAAKLRSLNDELVRLCQSLESGLLDQIAKVGEGSDEDVASAERCLARLTDQNALPAEITRMMDDAIAGLTEPIATMRSELQREYTSKEDFSQARSVGEQCLNAYNRARNELASDLVPEIESAIKAVVRSHGIAVPPVEKPVGPVNRLPIAAATAFAQDVDKIVNEWPGWWKRSWHAVTNFEYLATTERDKLRGRYASDGFDTEIRDALRALRSQVLAACRGVTKSVAATLETRVADMRAGALRQAQRRKELGSQLDAIKEFRPRLDRTRRALLRAITTIEAIDKDGTK